MKNLFDLLAQSGSIVPIERDKSSISGWNQYQKNPPSKEEVEGWIASGYKSFALLPEQGGFQVIDFDIKNHPNPANSEYFTQIWDGIPEQIQERLTVQTTRNNGIHLIYKCEATSSHLTIVKNPVTKKPVIETISSNNYFLIEPSEGYKVVSGSLSHVHKISPEEHSWLIGHCRTAGRISQDLTDESHVTLAVEPRINTQKSSQTTYLDSIVSFLRSSKIDITEDYSDWISLGYAIANELGESGRERFQGISENYPRYAWNECDNQYNQILKSASRRNNEYKSVVTTIKQLLKNYNIELPIDKKQVEKIEYAINFIQKKDYRRNLFTGKVEMKNNSDITDSEIDSCYLEIKQTGIPISKSDVTSIINSNKIEKYDPLKKWFQDAEQFASEQAIDELLACFEFKTKKLTEINFFKSLIVKWLMQSVAVVNENKMPRLVLVLIGGTYIGKTEFFRRLLPESLKKYYAESALDREKDSEILMCENLIVNVDELAGIMKSQANVEKFKSLASTQNFTLRVPYGKANEKFQRKALLCGTSNKLDVIQDHDSPNSRIIPVEITSIDKERYNAIDRKMLLGAIAIKYKSLGEKSISLNNEELETLKSLSSEYTTMNIEQELILRHFKKGNRFMTVSEITKHLSEFSSVSLNAKHVSREMKHLEFKKDRKRVLDSISALSGYYVEVIPIGHDYNEESGFLN